MIAVVGLGVVGKAVYDAFSKHYDVKGYDKFKEGFQDFSAILDSKFCFVSVPTPTLDGKQDLSALEEVLGKLSQAKYEGLVISKCTAAPGTVMAMKDKYGLRLFHSPEFLTARRPLEDFLEQQTILLGGVDPEQIQVLSDLFKPVCPDAQMIMTQDSEITELAKYMHNMYLTLKVSFCNEVYEICSKLGIEYEAVMNCTVAIGQMDKIHALVPGPDGKVGYGGMCFPKDAGAYIEFAKKLGVKVDTIEAAVAGNARRRPE